MTSEMTPETQAKIERTTWDSKNAKLIFKPQDPTGGIIYGRLY